jgi:hypothetical protein
MMATKISVRERLADAYEGLLFADGFDAAIVGVAERCGADAVVVYDTWRCIATLMKRDGLSEEEALDHFHFNVQGAYVGPRTPMWLIREKDL